MHRNDLCIPPAAIGLITRLGPTHTHEELVAELNAADLTTGKRRLFDIKAVRWARHAYRIRAPRTVPFREGEIGIDDMARILGVSYSAAYYWVTHHHLDVRQDRSGRWCVTWNAVVEADCRTRIARSGTSNPSAQEPGRSPRKSTDASASTRRPPGSASRPTGSTTGSASTASTPTAPPRVAGASLERRQRSNSPPTRSPHMELHTHNASQHSRRDSMKPPSGYQAAAVSRW
ncbi:hypothetical protein [Streptomyces sp. CA-106131]|uniref:hypothetical protein n=1 Tax=Streptomyces sp. CA-106131 TaxID=3240045 RepID=UPI003D8BF291